MMDRLRLPHRREHRKSTIEFLPPNAPPDSAPLKMHVSVSFHAPAAAAVPIALEVFIRGGGKVKVGSERDFLLDDVATALSLLMQLGMRPRKIRASLGQDTQNPGKPLTLVAAVLDAVIEIEAEYHAERAKLLGMAE